MYRKLHENATLTYTSLTINHIKKSITHARTFIITFTQFRHSLRKHVNTNLIRHDEGTLT